MFITTAEFLPQHHQQLADTRRLIAKAETDGQDRMVQMNRTVQTNLLTIIATLDRRSDCSCQSTTAGACRQPRSPAMRADKSHHLAAATGGDASRP
jgi:hypothetical protein